MLRLILVLAVIGVTIYALIDCLRSTPAELRGVPRPVWLLLIVVFAPVGGVVWIVVSRWTPDGPGRGGGGPRTVAPDDDPDFLHSLDLDPKRDGRRRDDDL